MPEILWEFKEVFDEELSRKLSPHRNCVLVIELEENVTLPRSKAYPLGKFEQELLKEYLEN